LEYKAKLCVLEVHPDMDFLRLFVACQFFLVYTAESIRTLFAGTGEGFRGRTKGYLGGVVVVAFVAKRFLLMDGIGG
jgi:hypothetical protein